MNFGQNPKSAVDLEFFRGSYARSCLRDLLKNDEMRGDEETLNELYDLYSEGRDDEVDKAVRVFQRVLNA